MRSDNSSAIMLQPRVIIFLPAILKTEVCSVTDFENKVDGILKKVRQLKNIYSKEKYINRGYQLHEF